MLATSSIRVSPPSVDRRRGDLDAAHVAAHTLWEREAPSLGRRVLAAWLDGTHGQGDRYVHVQWHLILFEAVRGRHRDAVERFERFILPAVEEGNDALTDAPSALWWIALTSPDPLDLPWLTVRRRALVSLEQANEPWLEVHNLLAVAGAGDVVTLDRWLALHRSPSPSDVEAGVVALATALRALCLGDLETAELLLDSRQFDERILGGSDAQNGLFDRLRKAVRERSVQSWSGGG